VAAALDTTLMTVVPKTTDRYRTFTAVVSGAAPAALIVIVRAQVAPEGGYGGLRQAPVEALLTGIVAPLVLGLFRRVDGKVDSARSRVGLTRGPHSFADPVSRR
jgi:hypothetical protein